MNLQIFETDEPAWSETLQGMPHDIYQRPEYLLVEAARTQSLPRAARLTDPSGEQIFLLPFLLRTCASVGASDGAAEAWDVTSPYGYCGYVVNAAAAGDPSFVAQSLRQLTGHWKDQGVCSAFLRLHPILNDPAPELDQLDYKVTESPTVSFDLQQSEDALWGGLNKRTRTAINKSRRLGCSVRAVDYREHLERFREIYGETMVRTAAASPYHFSSEYFQSLGGMGRQVQLMAVEHEGDIIAATAFFECDGIVQAHLGGSRSAYMKFSPFCQLLYETALWAKSRGNRVLHLGGGLGGSDDTLLNFKSGFSSARHVYRTVRIVVDDRMYQELVESRAANASSTPEALLSTGFFPAYRYGIQS